MRLRPATEADAEAAANLVIAVDIAHLGEADYTLGDLQAEWQEAGFELARDAAIVEDDAGAPVGYAHFRGRDAMAAVDPDREGEGAGTLLLDWIKRRGAERGERSLRQAVGAQGTRARELLEADGWTLTKHFWRMERPTQPDDAEPEGLRPLTAEDAQTIHAINEAAFAQVPGYRPQSREAWTRREFHAHGVDLALSRRTDDGFALVRRWPDDVLYVALLAVHPDAAGRGLGAKLLHGVFAAAHAAGQRSVQLNVAADNPNAVRLYERVGMTQRWRIDAYERPLPD